MRGHPNSWKWRHLTADQQLWSRIKIVDSGCWEWTGGKDQDGYGALRFKKEQRAHRVAYIFSIGEIPPGMMVLHKCDNPSCCNPLHLFLGTAKDNNEDMIKKGRQRYPNGDDRPNSKLTSEDVVKIRKMHRSGEFNQRQIARQFNVCFQQVNKIVHYQRWKHV